MERQSGLSDLSVISWVSAIEGCPLSGVLSRKFWSAKNFGPGDQNSWKIGPPDHYSENFGPRVELWSERKYFSVSTFNDTLLFQSVCIVS